jgi:O-antigen/teichoic acid export membrane protein
LPLKVRDALSRAAIGDLARRLRAGRGASLSSLRNRGGFAQNVLVLAGTTAVSQAALVVGAPVLTRLYEPSDFGLYAAANSILSLLLVVASMRYERAIPLPDDEGAAASLVVLCLVLVVATAVLASLIFILFGTVLSEALRAPALESVLFVVVAAHLGAGVYQTLSNWALREKIFSDIARTRFSQTVVTLVGQISLGVLRIAPTGLVIADAVGRAVGSGRLASRLWRRQRVALRRTSLASVANVARRYRRFALLAVPAALLNTLALQLPTIVLLSLHGPTVGGWYSLVQRVGAVPTTIVGLAVGQVFVAEAAQLARENPAALGPLFDRTWRTLLALAVGPFAVLGVTAPFLFPIVFGEQWREAGPYLTLLAPMYLVAFVANPVTTMMFVLERQDLVMISEVFGISLLALVVVLALAAHVPAMATVALLSIAGVLSQAAYFLLSRRAVRDYRPARQQSSASN